MIKTINPANAEILSQFEEHNENQIDNMISDSESAFNNWRKSSFSERSKLFYRLAELFKEKKEELANVLSLEMGKPITQSIQEIEKTAWVTEYYAESAEDQLKSVAIKTNVKESFVSFQPLGPIFTIMPWNYPYWQVMRFAAPAIMAGNTVILKHSPNTTACSIKIEELFLEAGFPENVLSNVLLSQSNVVKIAPRIIANPIIRGVTLTGSAASGAKVASAAGANLKKSVLELGGNDPYIVFADADLKKAAESCVLSRMINTGQTCIAAKRFVVQESVHDEFLGYCIEEMKKYKQGDPLDPKTSLGPMARKDLKLQIQAQTQGTLDMGAEILYEGDSIDSKGFYFPGIILGNVHSGMPAAEDEMFGPVASLIPFKTEAEAIEIANCTDYGLGAAIFTADEERARYLAEKEINAGACAINTLLKSDPRLPFGGVKDSGYGRELSEYGIHEFVNTKSILIA